MQFIIGLQLGQISVCPQSSPLDLSACIPLYISIPRTNNIRGLLSDECRKMSTEQSLWTSPCSTILKFRTK